MDKIMPLLFERVYDWPQAWREFYARWWLLLAVPRFVLSVLAITLVCIPIGIWMQVKEHSDKIRRGY